jgi:S1-C subfamily serine protease
MQLPPETRGALIMEVVEDGPAAEAGLQGSQQPRQLNGVDYPVGGDIIVAIDGTPVEGMDDLIAYLTQQAQPGDEVVLQVIRDSGQRAQVEVTLGERPSALR